MRLEGEGLRREHASNQVDVWMVRLNAPEGRLPGMMQWLDADEQMRAGRFRHARVASEFIQSHAGLRLLLAQRVGTEPADIRFGRDGNGKPFFQNEALMSFNLSHTRGHAAVAVAVRRQVGIDVEKMRLLEDLAELMVRVGSKRETEELQQLPSGDRQGAFFHLWTRKEALLKALGSGLRTELRQIDVGLEGECVIRIGGEAAQAGEWRVSTIRAEPGYAAAVAYSGEPCSVTVHPALDVLSLVCAE